MTMKGSNMTYLQITMRIAPENRPAAVDVYNKFKTPFLQTVPGARSKELLARDEDVQVLHGFDTDQQASDYLSSNLFNLDVVAGLKPLLQSDPEIRIYSV
jgi:hypothetical protein